VAQFAVSGRDALAGNDPGIEMQVRDSFWGVGQCAGVGVLARCIGQAEEVVPSLALASESEVVSSGG
jgi:hypothetical protein